MVTSLVTGGLGFIGSHLVDLLIGKGHKVIVIDDLSNGTLDNLNKEAIPAITSILAPDIEDIFKAHKISHIFHLAANARIPECTLNPVDTFKANVLGTLKLLELAKKYKVRSFVYSSSSSVYGTVGYTRPIIEINVRPNPISMYGLQKYQAEQLVTMYASIYDVPTVSLRYFNVYGTKRQRADGAYPNVMSSFIRDYKKFGNVTIYGDGEQKRDFVHVYDVIEANWRASQNARKLTGAVVNVGTGTATSINEIAKIFGFPTRYENGRKEDPSYSCASTEYLKEILDMDNFVTLKQGIKLLKESYEI